eukprot:4065211-Pyramimonas_sp.AAC.3
MLLFSLTLEVLGGASSFTQIALANNTSLAVACLVVAEREGEPCEGVGLLVSTDRGKAWTVRIGQWRTLATGEPLRRGVIVEKRDGEVLQLAQAKEEGLLYQAIG